MTARIERMPRELPAARTEMENTIAYEKPA